MKLIIPLLVLSLNFFSIDAQSQCNGAIFEEQNGIAIMEAETVSASNWITGSDGSAAGGAYLAYTGNDYFTTPGVNTLTYRVKINSPGTYRFIWRNRIGIISSTSPNTEHNDSWLKINASNFYAVRGSSTVYPYGSGSTPNPNGAGSGGWFKIYTNTVNWNWSTQTSDDDPHAIYATFNSVGVYDILVSGRSNGHWIDRLVLYKEGNYTASQAQSLSRAETLCGNVPPPSATINSFQLFNANTDVAIGSLSNGSVIDLSQINNAPLAVVANTSTTVSSVQFQLSGPISTTRTEGAEPFSLFGNSGTDYFGQLFPVGSYTLTATPATSTGTGTALTINFSVVDDTSPPPGNELINSFQLFNSDADLAIDSLNDGMVIDLSQINNVPLAVVANTDDSVSSVQFQLSGPVSTSRTEGAAPFALFGNSGTDYFGQLFPVGSYTLTATPATSAGTGTAVTINFSVVDNSSPPPSPVFSFILINPSTNQDISTLENGENIADASNINIRAVSPFNNTASVFIEVQGPTSLTTIENVAPYALFGDVNGNYNSGFLANGSYLIKAIAYSGSNGTGTNLGSTSVNFTVGASSAKSATITAFAYPNPLKSSKIRVTLPEKESGTIIYNVMNSSGIDIDSGKLQLFNEDKADLNLSSFNRMAPGVYYLRVQTLISTYTIPIIKN